MLFAIEICELFFASIAVKVPFEITFDLQFN